ncbi:hypothetical protein [Rhodoferax sp.]|uniref:hypothetical protein n=1 Tax=Rhodoferax sp. TaxID=50421 RepID=UPI0019F4B8CE|nr:hypothetical protein [Rhodoferax sp.]MBE0474270.1 hypothetical protein [Rhodoferax sp.]
MNTTLTPHQIDAPHPHHPVAKPTQPFSVLAWPAWRRVLMVVPIVLLLWLAVWWANMGVSPW